jgi:ketosteroid isomerase-like protein
MMENLVAMPGTDQERNLRPKDVVLKFLGYMSTAEPDDTEAAIRMFAADATFWVLGNLPMSGTLHGREEIKKRFRRGHAETAPGSKTLKIGTVVTEGEYVAAEWTSRRKTVGGNDYANTFFGLFQVRNGKIQSLREYMDTLGVKESGWDRVTTSTQTPMRAED